MSLSQLVESYKFWDVVTHWAKERLEHEETVARALARAVVCDGLILNSVDKRWAKGDREKMELKGYPYVGYSPISAGELMVLRAEALTHLLSVVQKAESPSRQLLSEEFISVRTAEFGFPAQSPDIGIQYEENLAKPGLARISPR